MPRLKNNPVVPWLVGGLLLLAIVVVFGQTLRFDFVNFDDNAYVYANPRMPSGLTPSNIVWAMTTNYYSMWAPVTWLSHLTDCQLYGFHPWGHHLTNLLIHAAAALLLFVAMRCLTDDLWPSALVAAIFAVHPLHVENVAWIAERKGLLGGFFFIATLWAYARYARQPFSWWNYSITLACFALGLMAKPIGVTLPFLFLLLDYWPLQRTVGSGQWTVDSGTQAACGFASPTLHTSIFRLLLEKLPFLLLAAAACMAAPLTQGAAVASLHHSPFWPRVANALTAYCTYLSKFFWPADLSAFYPRSAESPTTAALAALLGLAAISTAAIVWRRNRPYFFVGWFWFLGTMIPTIGLVQLGDHAMADRYMYVPAIGLSIAVAWQLKVWAAVRFEYRVACIAGVIIALAAFSLDARRQTATWRDSESLWTHALECNPRNAFAYNNLGTTLARKNQLDAAILAFENALQFSPAFEEAHRNLMVAMQTRDRNKANRRGAAKLFPPRNGSMKRLDE